ncbi:MAG: hypothetical protein AABX28_03310 [Nanoarchaeota archaeon]
MAEVYERNSFRDVMDLRSELSKVRTIVASMPTEINVVGISILISPIVSKYREMQDSRTYERLEKYYERISRVIEKSEESNFDNQPQMLRELDAILEN